MEPRFEGQINQDSGNAELVYIDNPGHRTVVASDHHIALFDNGGDSMYAVFGPYYEGTLPDHCIGVAVKLVRA